MKIHKNGKWRQHCGSIRFCARVPTHASGSHGGAFTCGLSEWGHTKGVAQWRWIEKKIYGYVTFKTTKVLCKFKSRGEVEPEKVHGDLCTAAKIWWGGEQWECCWNRYPKIWKWELSSLTTMCMWDNSIYWSEVTISLLLVIDRLTLFCFCFCWHKRDSDNPRYISTSINISV